MSTLVLSDPSRTIAGILLLSLLGVAFGGWYLSRIVRGEVPKTTFQTNFARAGHAHAGVLVILGLVCQILVDASNLNGVPAGAARIGVPLAAILIPAGFFLSSAGKNVEKPNGLFVLVYLGALSLAVGLLSLGIGLLAS